MRRACVPAVVAVLTLSGCGGSSDSGAAAKPYTLATLSKGQHSMTIVAKVTNVGTVNRTIVFNVG